MRTLKALQTACASRKQTTARVAFFSSEPYNYPPKGRSGNTGETNKVLGDYLAFSAKRLSFKEKKFRSCRKVFRKSGKLTYKYDNTCYLYLILSYLMFTFVRNVYERASK
jgi:hypothetical protein